MGTEADFDGGSSERLLIDNIMKEVTILVDHKRQEWIDSMLGNKSIFKNINYFSLRICRNTYFLISRSSLIFINYLLFSCL